MFGRSFIRLCTIGRILGRYGILSTLPIRPLGWFGAAIQRRDDRRIGLRLVDAFQDLGPGFIKVGQFLATRSDVIGTQTARDLTCLQDRLPPFASDQAIRIIEEDLGDKIENLFQDFDPKPIAAASIAQVHFATTSQGRKVAVKVLRPGIERSFERDFSLLSTLARMIERWLPDGKRLRCRETLDVVRRCVRDEMDFRWEAASASELRSQLASNPDFSIPAIDWSRTSRRVLTLERVDGIRIDNVAMLRQYSQEPRAVIERCVGGFFTQVFHNGFFHADLHPGNILIDPQGRIHLIDFGIMGRIDVRDRYFLGEILLALISHDYERVARLHFRAGYISADQSIDNFTRAVRAIGEPIVDQPLEKISLADLLARLFATAADFQMEIQPQLLLLQKSLLMAEGLTRSIAPQTNIWNIISKTLDSWRSQQQRPDIKLRALADHYRPMIEQLPDMLERTIRQWNEPRTLRLDKDTLDQLRPSSGWRIWGMFFLGAAAAWIAASLI